MKIRDDFEQSGVLVQYCTTPGDEHIRVWWKAKDEDGNTFPVQLQMTVRGASALCANINKAICELIDAKVGAE